MPRFPWEGGIEILPEEISVGKLVLAQVIKRGLRVNVGYCKLAGK